MGPTAKEIVRVRKPRLPKNRLLKKPRKELKHVNDRRNKPENRSPSRNLGKNVCPKCGSSKVFWASGLPQIWSVWECRNCGYRGAFIVRDFGNDSSPKR